MKKLVVIGIVVLLVGAGVYFWLGRGASGKTSYRTETVSRGNVLVAISATGTLNALKTVQVGSQVSGTISKLYADFNSQVTEGQLLAQLDPTFLQAQVNQQRANTDRAVAQFNDAQRTFNRTKQLFDSSLVSQADLDVTTTALETAKAGLHQAQAALDQSEVNLRYATIKAPISGVVISRNVDVGQTVAASLQAPTLFTIAQDLAHMQVQASIDEADIGSVKIGQPVTFRVDAFPDEDFSGVVSQVRLAPVVTQNVVTYNVIIDVANPEQKLMPGMTATVSIEVARKDDVLRVPLQALRFTPPGIDPREAMRSARQARQGQGRPGQDSATGAASAERRGGRQRAGASQPGAQAATPPGGTGAPPDSTSRGIVWVLENGKPKPVPMLRGLQDSRYAEVVRSPLKEGDSVIVGTTNGQSSTQTAPQGQNPFMPRMPGGGGRR